MLAIAVSSHELRYINWDKQVDEVRLVACQVIPWEQEVDGFHNVASIRKMIQTVLAEVEEEDQSLVYITLDAAFCNYSVMGIDPAWDVKEQLGFIRKNRFGDRPFYDSFQLALDDAAGLYLNIDCPTVLRRAVDAALPRDADGAAHQLSIGIFSAYSYANQVVPGLNRGRRLFWRASELGNDQFLEVQDGQFQALHLLQRDGSKVVQVTTVGRSDLKEPLAAFVEQLMGGEDALFPEIESVFVYLGSGNADFLASILGREQSSLSLLNPFWRWNWPEVPEADNRFTQSAFAELADAIWVSQRV